MRVQRIDRIHVHQLMGRSRERAVRVEIEKDVVLPEDALQEGMDVRVVEDGLVFDVEGELAGEPTVVARLDSAQPEALLESPVERFGNALYVGFAIDILQCDIAKGVERRV